MQKIEQTQNQTAEPQKEKQHIQQYSEEQAQQLTLALQAVQLGVPVTQLPQAMLLALSAQLGNQALLSLMETRNSVQPIKAELPRYAVDIEPIFAPVQPLSLTESPAWDGFSAIQTAPVSPSAITQTVGGEPFAGA